MLIIVGGYNSLWPAYLKMARDLEDVTGLPSHWCSAHALALVDRQGGARDGTDILTKLRETVIWARRRFTRQTGSFWWDIALAG